MRLAEGNDRLFELLCRLAAHDYYGARVDSPRLCGSEAPAPNGTGRAP